ncbi:hypothetical protein DIPPA_04876 [Diplonema papillatum]|nr:hypothetical protein DIPPA_04876 [Diplonema papillatum]
MCLWNLRRKEQHSAEALTVHVVDDDRMGAGTPTRAASPTVKQPAPLPCTEPTAIQETGSADKHESKRQVEYES